MTLLLLSLLTLIASIVGTVTGFGTSTIMVPVLVLFLPPVEAIFLVAIIHWFGDIWKMIFFRSGIRLRLILFFGLTGLLASFFGASLSLGTSEAVLLRALGFFIALSAIVLLSKKQFRLPSGNATAVAGGLLSGFFAGLFGTGGAIRGLFLSAFNLPKATYIATAGTLGLMADTARIVTYAGGGIKLPSMLAYGLLIFIPASLLGAAIAKKIVNHIPQTHFRAVVAIFLLLVGIKLAFLPN